MTGIAMSANGNVIAAVTPTSNAGVLVSTDGGGENEGLGLGLGHGCLTVFSVQCLVESKAPSISFYVILLVQQH